MFRPSTSLPASTKDVDHRDKPYDMHTSHRSVFTGLKKLSLFKSCIRDLSLNFPTHGSAKCLMQSLFLRCESCRVKPGNDEQRSPPPYRAFDLAVRLVGWQEDIVVVIEPE